MTAEYKREPSTPLQVRETPASSGLALLRADLPLAMLFILMLLLPLYRTAVLEDSFITAKVLLVQFCTFAAALGVLFGRRASNKLNQSSSAFGATTIAFAMLVIAHAVTIAWARSGALAAHAAVYWLTFLLLHITVTIAVRGARALNMLYTAGATAAVLTAAWTIFEDAAHGRLFGEIVARLPDWRGHLAAGLGNSGHIAGYMGLFLPWVLLQFLSTASRTRMLLLLGCLILLAAGFVITWSVGSSGATLISLAIWAFIGWRTRALQSVRPTRLLLLLVPLGAALAFYMLPHPLNPHSPSLLKEAFGSERWAEGWPTRIVIWKTTAHIIEQHPILGVGAGNFTLEYVRQIVPAVKAAPELRPYAGAFTNDAHNEYLHIWVEAGVAGMLCFIALIITAYVSVVRAIRQVTSSESRGLLICAGAGITVFLLDALMTFPLRLPAHFAALAMFLTTPAVLVNRPSQRPASTGVAAAFAAFVLLACMFVHGRQVIAAYHLKSGRTIVETAPLVISGNMASVWGIGDAMTRKALGEVAQGTKQQALTSLQQAQVATRAASAQIAEQKFRRALRFDPRYSNASSRLGALLLMKGDYAGSAEVTRRTLRDLESSEIWERLGFAEYLQNNYAAARKAWTICRDRRPVQADFYNALLRQLPQ